MSAKIVAALLLASVAVPALAADVPPIGTRVDRLEKEMKAVQRKVFPGGEGQYVQPEITAPAQTQTEGTPATTPIADLTARVTALEAELSRMTGQTEQNSFKLRQLEDAMNKMKAQYDARLGLMDQGAAPPPTGKAPPPAKSESVPDARAVPAPVVPLKPPVDKGDKAVAATPSSGDPGEDAYMAGYHLWADKKYPEAEAALKDVVSKYPKHKRASYAQNLLGRAYLDEGKPALAAEAFYANYQKMPRGERAPDSLYYLGQALLQLKKTKEACRVYDELQDVYGATMTASLKDKATKARSDASCS